MLEKLFTSGIRADILSLLFNSPEEKFYVREIARLVRKNPSGVNRELDNLEKMGHVIGEKVGNLKYFKVNKDSTTFPELKSLIAKSIGLPGALKSVLRTSDVKIAFIYGPYAEGSDVPSVDLFIVSDSNGISKNLDEVEKRFGREIHYVVMSDSEYKTKKKKGDSRLKKLLNSKKILLLGRL